MNISLLKSKTFWTGISGLVAAVGGVLTGALDLGVAIQTGVTSLVAIFLRDAIVKK